MSNINTLIQSTTDLFEKAIRPVYFPKIYDMAFKRRRSELVNRIPRNNNGVTANQVNIVSTVELPSVWGAIQENGLTPTGGKAVFAKQTAEMGCHAAAATINLHALTKCKTPESFIDLMDLSMKGINDTFPLYMRGLVWSSQNAYKALAKVDSINGLAITLKTGLWFGNATERAKLLERGMWLQAYRAGVKVGVPFKVTSVNKKTGVVNISADPGLAQNDTWSFSDPAGLDQRYADKFPGMLDVIDDSNTFQGIDRSQAANEAFRAVVTSGSGGTFNRAMVADFLRDCYDPSAAFCARATYDKYIANAKTAGLEQSIKAGEGFVDDVPFLQIGNTKLMVDDDVPEQSIIVPDFGPDGIRIADNGGLETLFGKGWEHVPGTTHLELVMVYWALMLAGDCRYMGRLHTIPMT